MAGLRLGAFLVSLPFFSALAKLGARYFPSLLGCMCVVRPPEAAGWLVSNLKNVRAIRSTPEPPPEIFHGYAHAPGVRQASAASSRGRF